MNESLLQATEKAPQPIIVSTTPDPEWAALEKKLIDGSITDEELTMYKDLLRQGNEAVKSIKPDVEPRLANIVKQQLTGCVLSCRRIYETD